MNLVAVIIATIVFIILFIIFIKLLIKLFTQITQRDSVVRISNKAIDKKESPTIREILELVTDNELSRNELFTLCNEFIKMPFPPKQGTEISSTAQEHLNFIIFIASHKNADAKLISYLNNEIKKKNPSYASQIEEYEKNGLEQRKNRR